LRSDQGHALADVCSEIAKTRTGNWIGYVAYDCGRLFEELPALAREDVSIPGFAFMHFDAAGESAISSTQSISSSASTLQSTFTRDEYLDAVGRILEYIRAGDVYQINLSQRFTAPLCTEPWTVFQRLEERSPAKFAAYLDFGDFQIISNSPELFVRVTPDRHIITRPIKGTRRRGPGMEQELRASEKDQAELAMIVDLCRNDLGRVCEIGSVRVVEARVIEEHPTVYHGVASIAGKLRDGVGLFDILRAAFPPGSVTGAPKIRAMQIIDEIEPVRRGPYCGAIGRISADGLMQFSVAIRTMIVKDGQVHIPVGGGIVADSDPAAEYDETLVKARAMFDAVGLTTGEP
ncbi:MAG: aminodeoxychorismate synthase component I, partial [Tepidisphaeraceae bacterium]